MPNHAGLQQQHQMHAFFGDKLLGAAASKVLREDFLHSARGTTMVKKDSIVDQDSVLGDDNTTSWPLEKGPATKLLGFALSNQFLRRHAAQIIPDHYNRIQSPTDHTVGSAVEAAVSIVYQIAPDQQDGATQDLARFLLEQAKQEYSQFNAKGTLLELGATFETTKHDNWLPERPLFETRLILGEIEAFAKGASKRQAENLAAQKLLEKKQPLVKSRLTFPTEHDKSNGSTAAEKRNKSLDDEEHWKPFAFSTNDISVRDGESLPDWWNRGAAKSSEAFRRALHSHHVFPKVVQSTQSWSCRWKGQYLAIIVLDCHGTAHSFAASSNKSFSKARSLVGLEANAHLKTAMEIKETF